MFQSNTNLGPYMSILADKERGRYRLAIYQAYNAMGLIGTEYNGIVVLDNEDMQVVADNLGVGTGIAAQRQLLVSLLHCSPEEFAEAVNSCRRARYQIEADTVPAAEPLFQVID